MTDLATPDAYGALAEPTTLKIHRLLPGPIERVWSYLTESDLRRQWLASGEMEAKPGSTFELVWRNDELSDKAGQRPDGMDKESRRGCTVIAYEPPHRLVLEWQGAGEVTFELEAKEQEVLLTLIHRRLEQRPMRLGVSAGWHSHLDVLVACLSGKATGEPFWDRWRRLRAEYDQRLPA